MACCLTAPSHYLNQCWLIISKVFWYSHKNHFKGKAHDIYLQYEFENLWFEITVISPRGQWVKYTNFVWRGRPFCSVLNVLSQLQNRAESRFAPSQWETALLCNDISRWLGASLESVLAELIDWLICSVADALLSITTDHLQLYNWPGVGLWGFLWQATSAKRKDHHGVSSGWNSVWHRSNTGLSNTQYELIPIILGVWPFWLTPFFFRSITFWRAYG